MPAEIVTHGPGQRDRLPSHLGAGRRIEQRRRGFLHDLLIAALDRAFPFAEMNDIAVLVAKHLDLDVARIDDEFLDEHPIVAERGLRFRTCALKSLGDLGVRCGDAHAHAAAAGCRLDHHRVADLVGNPHGLGRIVDHAEMAGDSSHLGPRGGLLALDLVAHGGDRLGDSGR